MKLIGNLKKQVEKAESKQEKKSIIENAGMLLTDDELDLVSGGTSLEELGGSDAECEGRPVRPTTSSPITVIR